MDLAISEPPLENECCVKYGKLRGLRKEPDSFEFYMFAERLLKYWKQIQRPSQVGRDPMTPCLLFLVFLFD